AALQGGAPRPSGCAAGPISPPPPVRISGGSSPSAASPSARSPSARPTRRRFPARRETRANDAGFFPACISTRGFLGADRALWAGVEDRLAAPLAGSGKGSSARGRRGRLRTARDRLLGGMTTGLRQISHGAR